MLELVWFIELLSARLWRLLTAIKWGVVQGTCVKGGKIIVGSDLTLLRVCNGVFGRRLATVHFWSATVPLSASPVGPRFETRLIVCVMVCT